MDVATLIQELGETPSATARATGLSRMTVHRIRDGVTSPTLSTLRELALAAGFDVKVMLRPASDAAASVAARVMLDPTYPDLEEFVALGLATEQETESIAEWAQRLVRYVGADDPREMLKTAGRLSAPQYRDNARFFAPRRGFSTSRMFEIADGALGSKFKNGRESEGAVSGIAAANAYLGQTPFPAPIVVWTVEGELEGVAARLSASLTETDEYQPGGIVVAPTLRAYFVDMPESEIPGIDIVSPIQAAIDLYGLGYDSVAQGITEGW